MTSYIIVELYNTATATNIARKCIGLAGGMCLSKDYRIALTTSPELTATTSATTRDGFSLMWLLIHVNGYFMQTVFTPNIWCDYENLSCYISMIYVIYIILIPVQCWLACANAFIKILCLLDKLIGNWHRRNNNWTRLMNLSTPKNDGI